tara:strand:- start:3985 stop:4194 length:210 start_codon:yes stop_codon:yes gene_type:complete
MNDKKQYETVDKVVKEIYNELEYMGADLTSYKGGNTEKLIKIILKQFECDIRIDQLKKAHGFINYTKKQ